MDAKIDGGESKIDGAHMGGGARTGAGIAARAILARAIVADADVALTQSIFNQTITTGTHVQFNSATIQASGHDLTDDNRTP